MANSRWQMGRRSHERRFFFGRPWRSPVRESLFCGGGKWENSSCDCRPLVQRESFSAATAIHARAFERGGDVGLRASQPGRQCVVQLLALLRKPRFDDGKESLTIRHIHRRAIVRLDADNGAVHLRRGIKRAGFDVSHDRRPSIELHTYRQQTQLARRCRDALRHFELNREHDQGRRNVCFQQMPDDGRGNIVRQIRHDFVRDRRRRQVGPPTSADGLNCKMSPWTIVTLA